MVCDGPDSEAGNKGTELLQRDGKRADQSLGVFVVSEVVLERLKGEYTADDSGVVSNCASWSVYEL